MVVKKIAPKPSLQRIEDARADIKRQIADERAFPAPNQELLSRLRKEKVQLKDLLGHLRLSPRFVIKEPYVFNMTNSVLELLRQYLQSELDTMLRGGKNHTNREFVRVQNELTVVVSEQSARKLKGRQLQSEAA